MHSIEIKKKDDIANTLYAQADDIYFGGHSLLELAKEFYAPRGRSYVWMNFLSFPGQYWKY
ncbi:MAG: hypothetical protein J1F67_06980 [Muribaculaceae bacterium]|nr:hypothetical protein [Muribaculaceae bacterium]